MADLHSLLLSRLENLRRTSDGWTARCPACAAEGSDKTGNHLRVWRSGAFACAKENKDGLKDIILDHNRVIRAWLYADSDPETLAALDVEFIDPEPKLDVERVFPEALLAELAPDYRYWVGRGISEDVLRRMGGGVASEKEKGKLSGRYVFPVRDDKGRITGWTGRLVSDASFGPTWKHLVKSSRCVYPIHTAAESIRASRKVVLLESVGDYLSCAEVGLWNGIVLLGLAFNARVLGLLASANPTHIIISTNSDTERVNKRTGAISHPGQDAADKLRAKLVPFFGEERVLIRFPKAAKDWNEVLKVAPDELRAFKAEIDAL